MGSVDAKQPAGIQDDHSMDGTWLGLLPHGFPLSSLLSSTQANIQASTFWEAQGCLRCLCLQFLGAACV